MKALKSMKTIFALYLLLFSVLAYTQTHSGNLVDDTTITTKIKAKVLADKNLSILKIDVSTTNGVVHLAGNVESDSQASELFDIVESVSGVKDIDATKLTINESHHPLSDLLITTKVKALFLNNKLFGADVAALTVHVETNNAVVYLTGTADSQKQVDNAIRLARSVNGVKDVVENVKIMNR